MGSYCNMTNGNMYYYKDCKWYAPFEGVCCNGNAEPCADVCPFENQEECEHYEKKIE